MLSSRGQSPMLSLIGKTWITRSAYHIVVMKYIGVMWYNLHPCNAINRIRWKTLVVITLSNFKHWNSYKFVCIGIQCITFKMFVKSKIDFKKLLRRGEAKPPSYPSNYDNLYDPSVLTSIFYFVIIVTT